MLHKRYKKFSICREKVFVWSWPSSLVNIVFLWWTILIDLLYLLAWMKQCASGNINGRTAVPLVQEFVQRPVHSFLYIIWCSEIGFTGSCGSRSTSGSIIQCHTANGYHGLLLVFFFIHKWSSVSGNFVLDPIHDLLFELLSVTATRRFSPEWKCLLCMQKFIFGKFWFSNQWVLARVPAAILG